MLKSLLHVGSRHRRTRRPCVGRSAVMAPVTLPTIRQDDRTDDCAFGADDAAPLGPTFRKLRFQMIADTLGTGQSFRPHRAGGFDSFVYPKRGGRLRRLLPPPGAGCG